MTKDKPVCTLKFHYMFDKNEFYFIYYEKEKDYCYHQHIWSSYKAEDKIKNNEIILNVSNIIDDSNTIVYEDIIEPYELALQDLLL